MEHQSIEQRVIADLRTDHAGETGAVWIYRGILAIASDPAVRGFAEHHLETEARHLRLIEERLAPKDRSRLIPLWRVAGWLTGAIPALFGPATVYHTIDAVETFVDHHYQEQIDFLADKMAYEDLRALLVTCQADEVLHRDEAREKSLEAPSGLTKVWTKLVAWGSQTAVGLARHI